MRSPRHLPRHLLICFGKKFVIGLLGLLCASCTGHAAPPPRVPAANPAAYRRLAGEVENNLQHQVLAQWFPRAADPQGGFFQNYGEDWSRGPGNEKSIVYQARLTWVAAEAARRYPAQAKAYQAEARHGLEFLADKLWDPQDGGFFWGLDDSGQPERGGEKHVYGISFAIYAACAAYTATHDPKALALAERAYTWLDSHAHDTQHGGYYEALTRAGTPILTPNAFGSASGSNDEIGTPYGEKTMNSHIHLLESLTALYALKPSVPLRTRLTEVFNLVQTKIAVESTGYLQQYFTPDWKPLPASDSFGHDVETAYLLTEASAALGKPNDALTQRLARRLVDHALKYGWDSENGGFYDSGVVNGPADSTEKVWWVQAEGLNALLLMQTRYGRETPRYWTAFCRQWQFIQQHQTDAHYGGWYAAVARDGTAQPGRPKSDGWTEAYHQGRALMNVSDALHRLAE